MAVHLLFFAKLRDRVGQASHTLTLNVTPCSAKDLIAQMPSAMQQVLLDLPDGTLHCAINHQMSQLTDPVADGDEVAFFPPVTGG